MQDKAVMNCKMTSDNDGNWYSRVEFLNFVRAAALLVVWRNISKFIYGLTFAIKTISQSKLQGEIIILEESTIELYYRYARMQIFEDP